MMRDSPEIATDAPKQQRRWRGGRFALAAFFAMTPGFSVGGAMALPAAQALTGLAGAPWRRLARQNAQTWVLIAALALFVVWASASTLWAPDPHTQQGLRLIGGVICGVLFVLGAGIDAPSRRLVRAAGAACAIVLIASLAVEALADMPINRLAQPHAETGWLMRNPSRGASAALMLTWGAIAGFLGGRAHEKVLWKLIALGAFYIALQFSMDANALAFAFGAVAFVLGYGAFRFTLWLLIAGIAGWLIAAPWATPALLNALGDHVPASWIQRGEIWRFVCERIAANPWLGEGLDASRHHTTIISGAPALGRIPLHPHSGSLQIWFETGAVGAGLAVLALIAVGMAGERAFRDQPPARGALCAVIASAGVIGNVSYGVWQEWWIAALFAGVALAVSARRAAWSA